MATLTSYVASQHCAGVDLFMGIGNSPRMQGVQVVMSLHDPGFLQTSGFSTVFANDIEVQCPMLLWVWLQFELVCDDPRNNYSADDASATFSLLFRRKRLRKSPCR